MLYPFDYEKEVAQAKSGPRGKLYNYPISPRQNDILTASHKDPAWLGQDLNHVFPREILDNVARGFVIDGAPFTEPFGGPDMFGVEWVYVPVVRGSMEKPGFRKVKDINNWEQELPFPDLERLNWPEIQKRCSSVIRPDKITSTMVYTGFFERLISILGFEDAAMALIDEDCQDAIHRLFSKLCLYYDSLFDHLQRYCGLEYVVFHDDWGSQHSLFFSVNTCREMLLPYLTRVVDSAHKRGIYFNFHCCGNVERLVPVMVEAGCDAWDGQDMNDIWGLYHTYGDRLNITLNQKVLTIGPEEAEKWVDRIISHLEHGKQLVIPNRQMNEIARELLYIRSREFYGRE